MKITAISARDLTGDDLRRWSDIQRHDAELQSPFFHPTYVRAAAAALPGVEVAIVEEDGAGRALFLSADSGSNVGIPVGGSLNDFQGVCAAGLRWTPPRRSCGLPPGPAVHALLASQRSFLRLPLAYRPIRLPRTSAADSRRFAAMRRAAGSRSVCAPRASGGRRFACWGRCTSRAMPRTLASWRP